MPSPQNAKRRRASPRVRPSIEALEDRTAPAVLISEILFDPPGTDSPNEFVEIRATAGERGVPANTFLVAVEGDAAENPGAVQAVFNLSGLAFGTNGFLVLRQSGSTLASDPSAATLTGVLGFRGAAGFSAEGGATEIENGSTTFLLVRAADNLVAVGQDLDPNNDGIPELPSGWTVLDGVAVLDGGATDRAYAAVAFANGGAGTTAGAAGAGKIVAVDFTAGYVARIGADADATSDAWVAAVVAGAAPNFTLAAADTQPASFGGLAINTIGAANAVETTAPTLTAANIVENDPDNIIAVNAALTYTLAFSEDVESASLSAADFSNSGTAAVTVNAVNEVSPGVVLVQVTPTTTGTLILQAPAGATITDLAGNLLAVPVVDDTTITVNAAAADDTPPAVVSVTEADADNLVGANVPVTFTVRFSEDINAASVSAADFQATGTAAATVGAIAEVSPGVFTVQVTATTSGTLGLQVPAGATITDVAGNAVTGLPVAGVQTLLVDAAAPAVTSIVDDDDDNVVTVGTPVTFTVIFSESVDASTVSAGDFQITGSAQAAVGAVNLLAGNVVAVQVTPTTTGTLGLQVPSSATIGDLAGNALAGLPVSAPETVTVIAAPTEPPPPSPAPPAPPPSQPPLPPVFSVIPFLAQLRGVRLAVGNVVGDQTVDLVFSIGRNVFVLDGATGQLAAVIPNAAGPSAIRALVVVNLDADPEGEIVVLGGRSFFIYDGSGVLLAGPFVGR